MKGQVSSQVFVYILAVVIAGIILLVGTKVIGTLVGTGKSFNLERVKSDFMSSVEVSSRQYGSIKKVKLEVPANFDTVCFADSREEDGKFKASLLGNSLLSEYPLIKNSIENNAKENVFILKGNKIEESFEAGPLDVEEDFICIENTGAIELWLKGIGKKALLYI